MASSSRRDVLLILTLGASAFSNPTGITYRKSRKRQLTPKQRNVRKRNKKARRARKINRRK